MKLIIAALAILFLVLQYQLWFAEGGLFSVKNMQRGIEKQQSVNATLEKRNNRLKMDIEDLKHGQQAVEAYARNDLGMIKNDETFYQIVSSDHDDAP